ncbi:PREDICTED: uncharacterized protein KIAA1109 isoform X3 [Nicrophorus vespilloides]|uniref:Uncharacterized protein KIAA1109 isoform X3 n=1 Tax=Nicrophorus vespilloides TaxID=110193 RepID=A0ABM1N372_NICVS|nr:PREDICTED: uncharacterized protein KIAA1109 isoform X3 [Nicrophorus vespilloides]
MGERSIGDGYNMPEAWAGNNSSHVLDDIKMDSNFLMLLGSLIFAITWVIYITYYNSRIFGCIITNIVNRFLSNSEYFQIGSFTINALSGKIMFRDLVFITHDYTVRIQDGYLIFRWWRSYVPKDVSEDLSHSDTRLSVVLHGFELHVYNRSHLYSQIERIFGLDPGIFPDNNNEENNMNIENIERTEQEKKKKQRSEAAMAGTWRDLIPVIKIDISSCRLVFGNKLVPTTLSVTVEESHFVYSTKPAVNTLDRFMHFTKCKAENARVMLAPSPKYTGMLDEPPRYMGEGFVLMSTNDMELYFYMDEPGIVPDQPVTVTLANGDVVESSPPQWGMDIKCGKGTDFSYGPWADRQREHLFKFFYPQDYVTMKVTEAPKPGDKRQMQSFDVRLSMQYIATIDILFSKNKETNAVHVTVGAGSYLEITIPWVTNANGYITKINGQLLHLEATTSLQFRDLAVSETLEFSILCHYPRVWNEHQLWEVNMTGCKATVNILFNHKWFFQDFINDWSSKQRPDILHFVPYTWNFGLTLKHCEIITLVNQYNWVDCSSIGHNQRLENTQIALCAHFMHLSFNMPFDEFLPDTVALNFSIQGESIDLTLFIPEFHTSRNVVTALEKYAKVHAKDASSTKKTEAIPKWRNICQKSFGWIDFWWIPIGAISIVYEYHPCPPLGPTPQADISTPVKEEILLSPIRPHQRKRKQRSPQEGVQKFDPTSLKADLVTVELEVGPSVLLLYGTALRNFLNFKENIFGEDQMFTDFKFTPNQNHETPMATGIKSEDSSGNLPLELRDDFDHRNYRPLEVDVSVIMHDIQGHLLKNCTEKDPSCPVILVERFGFEMKKRYDQTELQLLLSPAVLLVTDNVPRAGRDKHLSQGRLTLSSLQIRGHAMFSDIGRTLDEDTIEYSWLVEIQLGKLSGRLTTPQLYSLLACLETLILLLSDTENELYTPKVDDLLSEPQVQPNTTSPLQNLPQAIQQLLQPKTNPAPSVVPPVNSQTTTAMKSIKVEKQEKKVSIDDTIEEINDKSHDLKYKFTRLTIDAIDLWLVENGSALQMWVSPIRLSTCNLHGKQVGSGLTCVMYSMALRHCVWQPQKYNHSKTTDHSDLWLEVGTMDFAPLVIESAMSTDCKDVDAHAVQQKFLKTHDERFKKLWFLWPESNKSSIQCGCTGGCLFFGNNANGRKFFKPSRKDLEDGTNIAAFKVNEPGQDPGYGQSILHEGMLIFRTPPYIVNEISLQDHGKNIKVPANRSSDSPRVISLNYEKTETCSSPHSLNERKVSRRYSSTSIRSGTGAPQSQQKDVPYSRLVDPAALPIKLDSDSKLHKDKAKLSVNSEDDDECVPKNSASDSKLAVDYFNSPKNECIEGSDSHHSLGRRLSEEQLQKEVQRTISMSSENHSEAFFSADEDMHINSRSSSLRNSMLSSNGTLTRQNSVESNTGRVKKKFSSELSIVADKNAGTITNGVSNQTKVSLANGGSKLRLSSHRSDHEIHTPEHRSFNTKVDESNRVVQGLVTPQRHAGSLRTTSPRLSVREATRTPSPHNSTGNHEVDVDSSDSYSSTSYVSAIGSQEDFTLVDLHMQVNRLIVDSPMLMSSYVSHLNQMKCLNWGQQASGFTAPLFEKDEADHLVYVGGRFVPQMETVSEGVTSLKMVSRLENPPKSGWDTEECNIDVSDSIHEEELLGTQTDVGSRTSLIIKMKGDLDVMITPLLLESLQRFIDALTPTVANLHPLTVVNHLHACCIGQVEAANVLKTVENVATLSQPQSGDDKVLGIYEETLKSQLQAAIVLPKVNITLLQASIVEEIISFSALDNIKDLTCVSMFSVSFDNITTKFHLDRQANEVLQKFYRPAVVPSDGKKGKKHFLSLHTTTNADIIRGEPVYVQSCEKQQQQLVVSLNIGKIHTQLRRLKNESSILEDAVITAIPANSSKVLFTCLKLRPQHRAVDYYMMPEVSQQVQEAEDEDRLGFIMFECGLEGVSLKIVKKSCEEQSDGDKDEDEAKEEGDGDKATPKVGKKKTGPKDDGELVATTKDSGNVSSCIIEFKMVWFNFAAPPKTPITRKIDYTRLDWNLLSTASPAINAWMNPSNRLAIRVVHMVRSMYRRSTATVACLMTEALELPSLHMTTKSRYGKLTPLSKTLHEDPSCRLCTILHNYYLQADPGSIESNLRESDLPQLFTLRQGVVALSRQWKSQLHTPLMNQYDTKSKVKPLNLMFSIPTVEEVYLTDGEGSGNEDHDITDEHAQLLHSGIILKPQKPIGKDGNLNSPKNAVNQEAVPVYDNAGLLSPPSNTMPVYDSGLVSPSAPVVTVSGIANAAAAKRRKKSLQPSQVPPSSRASVVLPLLTNPNIFMPKKTTDDAYCYGTLREDRAGPTTAGNLGSDPSVTTHSSPDLPSSPLHDRNEDLYSWMARQNDEGFLKGCMESKINTLQTDSTDDDNLNRGDTLGMAPSLNAGGVNLYAIQDSVRFEDANIIFQPLLSSLGVMPQQLKLTSLNESGNSNDVTSLDALGSNLSLVGNMETMRIDIVVSEHGKTDKRKGSTIPQMNKSGSKCKPGSSTRLIFEDECPAFVCEKISVELEVDRMTDMAVNDMIKTRNVLYISRGQLKNHTSTVINFNIGVRYISQRVNMPLLRLLHQISNMYQNVKDTQNELREQQPVEIRRPKTSASDHVDIKNHSSVSDLHDGTNLKLSLKISDPGSDVGSVVHQNKPVISPSPSVRSRPQSFAQKLRSTGKSVKGYVNLSEGVGTPVTLSSPSGSAIENITNVTLSSDKSVTVGRCWKTMYHVLDLYANMPDHKTIKHRFSVAQDIWEYKSSNRKYDQLNEVKSTDELDASEHKRYTPILQREVSNVSEQQHTKLVVFGVARIHRTKLLATLSVLKLEAEITSLHASLTCRKKSSPASLECSLTGQVGRTMIVLLEGVAPNQQTVVKVTVGKSQALYSSVSKRGKDKNSGLLTVGAVNIDIPQHPVALHGMVTRGSKQLSSTLQELRVTRTSSRLSRPGNFAEEDHHSAPQQQQQASPKNQTRANHMHLPASFGRNNPPDKSLLQPLVMQFSVILQSLSINAALLPSLQAQYKMDQVTSTGVTGSKAKFTIDLPQHSLSFTTKLQVSEANLPSEASISLPAVHVSAEYIPEGVANVLPGGIEGVVFKQGGYLNAQADIGVFEHSLTTDLLNHLVFVQKVFMKEVNEVVQKVYGGERPVAIWLEDSDEASNRILFSLVIQMQRIQLTATTAGSSAVRMETGAVVLELSNRVQNVSAQSASAGGGKKLSGASPSRLFGKAQVDLNLSLGQLIRNALFEEAEAEFQQFAFFNTRIGLRNAFQDEVVDGEDKEVVLITLKRPLIYIQPVAVDKAILVWLNYKNAYDYWNEKRANLNKEVLTATQQVYEKFQFGQLTSQLGNPHLGMLFLQLTVEDMGICLPLNPLPLTSWGQRGLYEESRGAVVITLENTSISACSSGSLVSKGKFSNLCLRFADDFETSLDDWKPDMSDATIMNLCVVSDGTYEVCSRTIAAKQHENAKWFLNVQWQMEGVDIHLDTNVGKQLSALGHTLTMLTGAEDTPLNIDYDSDDNEPLDRSSQESILPSILFDANIDTKIRSKMLENLMNEQAKIINDLRSLGASHGTIEMELKKFHKLENMVYKDFRMDMIQKLRRQSVKPSGMKGKLGMKAPPPPPPPPSASYRSKSFVLSQDTPSPDAGSNLSPNSGSFDSSPRSGPSRSASLRVRSDHPHVTFSDAQSIERQYSLPSASSDLSLPDSADWPGSHHIDIDGEQVPLRKKPSSYEFCEGANLMDSFARDQLHSSNPYQSTGSNTQTGNMQQKSQEPNIDLELDVKVFINSGKCVLHTKDTARDEEIKLRTMRKDRSCSSAGLLDFTPTSTGSPDPSRRNKDSKFMGQTSSTRLRNTPHVTLVDLTIFHIPGMDVKLLYQSKVIAKDTIIEEETPRYSDNIFDSFSMGTSTCSTPAATKEQESSRIDRAFKRQDSLIVQPTDAANFTNDFNQSRRNSVHGISNPNYTPTSSREDSLDTFPFQLSLTPSPLSNHVPLPQTQYRKPPTGIKKASLFAWMTLQSVPEETIISPHILEFLEQTLEPIPAKTNFNQTRTSILSDDQDGTNYGNYVYASFPVDVIVYFHMQPSTFRFSCLPVSRVECMLQLPSLDIVFSSKRAEDELLHSEFGDGTPNTAATAVGGLSVTGCLSDFSVYIFHPYGGKKSALKEAQWSPLSDSERKDSLSINVEFVKFHLSRSRMLNFNQELNTKSGKSSDQGRNVIRFSTITDIGSASFKYDMRRLTEILAFPKAWYRRSIVRRMFLGDLSMSVSHHDDDDLTLPSKSSPKVSSSHRPRGAEKSPLSKDKLKLALDGQQESRHKLRDAGRTTSLESRNAESNTIGSSTPSPSEHKATTAWETLVLFAVNFKKLNVHMNMGNVMGNVSWLTKEFRSEGRLSIGSTGHKNLYIAVGLGGSGLDAKGGIVGGNIEIANIDTYIHIREEPNVEPDHTVGLRLRALELRLDYMATSVLMCRVSDLKVKMRDEWLLNRTLPHTASLPTRRPASIFMYGDLSWDQLQIMMSKSSTADLLKMFNKLEEFFSQQFNSSKRAFSGFSSQGRPPKVTPQRSRDGSGSSQSQQQTQQQPQTNQQQSAAGPSIATADARHHRHWQRVLAHVAGLRLSTMHVPLPDYGTVLGGTMQLHGKNISLACFHGINFKSKSWALFSLREPCINFNTEAQEVPSGTASFPAQDVHVVQTLTCSLGLSTYKNQLPSMATVYKVSRTVIFPPQFKTLQEWFHYAFANSHIDEVDRFPSLEREKDGSMERSGRGSTSTTTKLTDPQHNREVIFALPSLQLHLKTEHWQTCNTPDLQEEKPTVECSFITEFEDHIFVTVDAEAFFFLHDLITSYVKEKDKLQFSSSSRFSDISTKKPIEVDIFTKDWRNYHCKTWHLEPTVRLLSVAGKYIEPYGIDYILQKLGFSHARTTIPKWMQRGFMDPLDAILAVLTLQMVQVVKGDGNRESKKGG